MAGGSFLSAVKFSTYPPVIPSRRVGRKKKRRKLLRSASLHYAIYPIQTALFLRQAFIVSISLTAQKNPGTPPSQTVTFSCSMKHRGELVVVSPPRSRATFKISVLRYRNRGLSISPPLVAYYPPYEDK